MTGKSLHSYCPLCNSSNLKVIFLQEIRQFLPDELLKNGYNLKALKLLNNDKLGYNKCLKCSFIFANPTVTNDFEKITYNEAKSSQKNKIKKLEKDKNLTNLYNTHHKWVDVLPFLTALGTKFDRFKKPQNHNKKQISLLDIGCGFGHTLELSKVFGIHAVGCDLDNFRLDYCKKKGLNVKSPDKISGQFDIVLSCNVIEHVYNLDEYIQMINKCLKKDGILIFSGLDEKIVKIEKKTKKYKLLNPIEHKNIFNRKSLSLFLNNNNLRFYSSLEIFRLMNLTRSKAIFYLPYFFKRGYFNLNGVFSAIAKKKE